MGRKPADNPLVTAISFRVDKATAEALDAELESRLSPGLQLSRNDLARMLVCERLAELHTKPTAKKK